MFKCTISILLFINVDVIRFDQFIFDFSFQAFFLGFFCRGKSCFLALFWHISISCCKHDECLMAHAYLQKKTNPFLCLYSSCLEELSFSAERIEIINNTFQVTLGTPELFTRLLFFIYLFFCLHSAFSIFPMNFLFQKHKKDLEALLMR